MKRDPSLDALLDLDGQILVIDPITHYWVRFVVRRVPVSEAKPHGLDYSLTLHGTDGARVMGFDNAHAVGTGSGPGRKRGDTYDHRHRGGEIKPYVYQNAATLLADFWDEVERTLQGKGIKL